jgi:hypothetical protein
VIKKVARSSQWRTSFFVGEAPDDVGEEPDVAEGEPSLEGTSPDIIVPLKNNQDKESDQSNVKTCGKFLGAKTARLEHFRYFKL